MFALIDISANLILVTSSSTTTNDIPGHRIGRNFLSLSFDDVEEGKAWLVTGDCYLFEHKYEANAFVRWRKTNERILRNYFTLSKSSDTLFGLEICCRLWNNGYELLIPCICHKQRWNAVLLCLVFIQMLGAFKFIVLKNISCSLSSWHVFASNVF